MALRVKCTTAEDEKHGYDVTCLIAYKNVTFSGADDGKIIKWDEHLKKLADRQAHPCSIYSLAVIGETIYSCSNDGTVKSWTLDLHPKSILLQEECEFWKMDILGEILFVGDDQGSIRTIVNDKQVARYDTLDGIKDMKVFRNFIYTSKDIDVTITEMGSGGPKSKFATRKVTRGRAPLTIAGNKLIFVDFTAKGLSILENDPATNFKPVANIQGAHSMIINALSALESQSNDEIIFYTGSWDKTIKKWKIVGNECKEVISLEIGMVVTTLLVHSIDYLYAGLENGYIKKIEVI